MNRPNNYTQKQPTTFQHPTPNYATQQDRFKSPNIPPPNNRYNNQSSSSIDWQGLTRFTTTLLFIGGLASLPVLVLEDSKKRRN